MNKKVLTMQDISCYGQCSTTVALPIISAWGYETAILPSAILSTHTGGFKNFTVHDLSDEIPKIINHWKNEGIKYDAFYVGYLGEIGHIDLVIQIKNELLNKDGFFVLDPVMGDNGKLYPAFNEDYVQAIKRLVKEADIILPNLTEACFLTGVAYKEEYDEDYIKNVINKLLEIGAKRICLTGIAYKKEMTGVVIYDENGYQHFIHRKINKSYHGTGDVYASTFLGAFLGHHNIKEAAITAAEFVVKAIENTLDDPNHNYGVKFEPLLAEFIKDNR
ncbi:MAG: pyridoxamine kinase [Bacilli bacterium]|nr:pyridoxamine kinase [Bacilli bacterium]